MVTRNIDEFLRETLVPVKEGTRRAVGVSPPARTPSKASGLTPTARLIPARSVQGFIDDALNTIEFDWLAALLFTGQSGRNKPDDFKIRRVRYSRLA